MGFINVTENRINVLPSLKCLVPLDAGERPFLDELKKTVQNLNGIEFNEAQELITLQKNYIKKIMINISIHLSQFDFLTVESTENAEED